MISDQAIKKAMANGQRQAENVIKFRNRALQERAKALAKVSRPMRRTKRIMLKVKTGTVAPLGPRGKDVLIAEGDSWFDYPLHDILRILEDHYGYDVESVAHKGDKVEEMAYADGQLEKFTRLIEKVLRNGLIPKAILLSGGGNDVAGKEFGMLLNHHMSAIAGLNDSVITGVIDERALMAYITVISTVTGVCLKRTGQPLPIILHGYDYPVPDGRGFLGGWWFLPGPWLEPGFREKGFFESSDRIRLAKDLIDRFNAMLSNVASLPGFDHVHYIDLRGTLSVITDKDNYKKDWANELHPTGRGFKKVTDKFAQTIETLP